MKKLMIKIIPVLAIAGLLIAALLYRCGDEQEIKQNKEETDELDEERINSEIAALKLKKMRRAKEAVVGEEVMARAVETVLFIEAKGYKKQFNKPLPICEQCSELEYLLILKRAIETENADIEEQRNELYNLKKGKIVAENELENVETEYKKKFNRLIPWWVCSDEERLMRLKKALETNKPYPDYPDVDGYLDYEISIAIAEYDMRFKKLPPECHCSGEDYLESLEIALKTGMPYPTREKNDSELLTASINFGIGGWPIICETIIMKTSTGAIAKVMYGEESEKNLDMAEWLDFVNSLYKIINKWKEKYYNNKILDGTQWSLNIYFLGKDDKLKRFRVFGSNEYPENWNEFANIMGRVDGTNTLIKKMERTPPRGRSFKK